MRYSRLSVLSFVVSVTLVASPAYAGDQLQFNKIPDWVEEIDLKTALKNEKSSESLFVILDKQVKLEKDIEHGFTDLAIRIVSPEILTIIGNFIKPSWQPQQGDLIIHRLEVVRGDELIRPLDNGFEFEVIRQEKNLEKLEINGELTATAQIPDIQVGDIIRFTASVTKRNPALDGNVQFNSSILEQSYADWPNRLRIIWPESEDIQWKISVEEHPYTLKKAGRYHDLRMSIFLPEKETKIPSNSPNRFRITPFVDATSFRSWEQVSTSAAKLYKTDGLIADDSALGLEVDAIAESTKDPLERTALALQLVQDQIRYLYNGLGFGNYTPQSPAETWRLRYGDCKAKTLLLVAILHRLGIEAEPALVNTKLQDAVPDRLPAFQVFDHIMVRAVLNGKILWLDGTSSGARIDDLGDIPDHRYALPVREGGATLEALNIRPVGRPYHNVKTQYDLRAGTALPAVYEMTAVLRTKGSNDLRSMGSQLTPDKYREALDELATEYVVGKLVTSSEFSYDDERGEGTIKARGISYLNWKTRLGKKRQELWNIMGNINLKADRSNPEWRDIPVKVTYPVSYQDQARFLLPNETLTNGETFTVAGKASMDEVLAGYNIRRDTHIEQGVLTFNESYNTAQWEIPAEEIPLMKKKLAAAKKKKVALVAPKSLMEEWKQIETLRGSEIINSLTAEFDRLVERDPENDEAIEERAYFYQTLGEYDKAAADLALSLEIKPDPATYHWRAELLVGSKRKQAIKDLESALDLNPIHSDSIIELVDIYVNAGNSGKARKIVETARSKGLSDEESDKLIANILQSEGNQEEADILLTQLIEDDPENLSLLNERCWLRGRGNFKLEEALEDCTEAVELAQKPSAYLDSRALVYYRLGMYDDAIADLNRALRLKPDMPSSRYLRAIVHRAKGKSDAAENDYRAALHLYKYIPLTYDRFGLSYN